MSIPDYQEIMLPFLQALRNRDERPMADIRQELVVHFGLSPQEREALLPSGNQGVFENRVGWARTYLKKAGLLEYVRRGVYCITTRGLSVLEEAPEEIDIKYLDQFPEFQEFRKKKTERPEKLNAQDLFETPDEVIEVAYQQLRDDLASELSDQVQSMSWQFFELLVKMGYGGSRKEAGEAFQRGSDEGIDGTIKEDRLGLDIIYVQAKRWKNGATVGRPEIQKFAGALQGKRARKGVFITTAEFTNEAIVADQRGQIYLGTQFGDTKGRDLFEPS